MADEQQMMVDDAQSSASNKTSDGVLIPGEKKIGNQNSNKPKEVKQKNKSARAQKVPCATKEEVHSNSNAKPGWYGHKHTCPAVESHRKQSVQLCPFASVDWNNAGASHLALTRAQKDIAQLHNHQVDGIYLHVDESNLMFVHAMIVGTPDSPYAGGFFHFMFRFGPKYPFEPPRVCCMTSYRFGNSVRFHPNLYANGYVCLSMLGTWDGPRWSAANNLTSVLLSIQSILTSNALCHEPGMKKRGGKREAKDFDVYALHETLRVAVLETVKHAESYKLPESLIHIMRRIFLEKFDSYISSCDEYIHYDRLTLTIGLLTKDDVFTPNFGQIKLGLIALKQEIEQMAEIQRTLAMGSASNSGAKPKTLSSSSSTSGEFSSLSELKKSLPVSSGETTDGSSLMICDASDLWSNSDQEESDGDSYEPSEDDDDDAECGNGAASLPNA